MVRRRAHCFAFIALSISLRKHQLFPSTKVGAGWVSGKPSIQPLGAALGFPAGGLLLNSWAAFQFPLQLPPPAPQASYNYPHNKEGLMRATSLGGARAGHWLPELVGPGQEKREACAPLSVALALMDFFSSSLHISCPFLCCLAGVGGRCVHQPSSPEPLLRPYFPEAASSGAHVPNCRSQTQQRS